MLDTAQAIKPATRSLYDSFSARNMNRILAILLKVCDESMSNDLDQLQNISWTMCHSISVLLFDK